MRTKSIKSFSITTENFTKFKQKCKDQNVKMSVIINQLMADYMAMPIKINNTEAK